MIKSKKKKKNVTATTSSPRSQKKKHRDLLSKLFINPKVVMKGPLPQEPGEDLTVMVTHLVRLGVHVDIACLAVGVSKHLFKKWMVKGERDIARDKRSSYASFAHMVEFAEAQAEVIAVSAISTRADKWQANAWLLERRAKERWASKITHSVGGDLDAPPIRTEDTGEKIITADYAGKVLAILEASVGLEALRPRKHEE